MKLTLFLTTGLLLVPAAALAQTAPATVNGIPNTPLSTSTEPSTGPRSQQADLPTNNAAAAMGGGMQAPPTVTVSDPNAPPMAPMSPTPAQAFPAPAPLASYPMCSATVFDQCMEPGNGGAGTTARHRPRSRHRRR